jgi:voltage-gated potassium channel
MNALGESFRRRGFKYVLFVTLVVVFGGAAGMFALESARDISGGFETYGDALWWTAMLMTTLGGAYVPQTAEGRILNFILALYAFVSFGYITATLATFFVERDAQKREKEKFSEQPTLAEVQTEISEMRKEIMKILNDKQTQS